MTHDPLCPRSHPITFTASRSACECPVIARVREDERTYAKQTSTAIMAYDEGKRDGYAAALRDAAEAVIHLVSEEDPWSQRDDALNEAVIAIEHLGGTNG